MATRPFVDKPTPPIPVVDRLQLAEELLDLAERTQAHTRATGSAIALLYGEKLLIRTSTGIAPEVGSSLPMGEGSIGQCARFGKPLNVTEDGKMDAALLPLAVRSLVAVPIHHAGIFYGVLAVFAQSPEAFTRMHVAIMMTMGNEVARILKRMDAVMDFVTGTPLQAALAPVAAPAENVVTISRTAPATPAAPQSSVETLKATEQKPAPPMQWKIDPPLPLRLSPPTETAATVPNPAQQVAAVSLIELETPQEPPPPLPDLLCPGEDPRQYGTLKTAKSLEPKPTFALTSAYERPASSSRMKAPAVAAAVLIIAAAAFGMWRHSKASAVAHEAVSAAVPAAPPVLASAPAPEIAKVSPVATPPVAIAAPTQTAKKPSETKEEDATSTLLPAPALRIATAPAKTVEVASVEAPSLAFAAGTGMPELPAPKLPAASLAVKRSTVSPPALLRTVAPIYPELARRSGTFGEVRLQLTVSPAGKVTDVHVLSGAPMLRQAATYAVSRWEYRPATLDGRAVESSVDVVVKFGQR